jgi:peptidoglycan glycosyltransferase
VYPDGYAHTELSGKPHGGTGSKTSASRPAGRAGAPARARAPQTGGHGSGPGSAGVLRRRRIAGGAVLATLAAGGSFLLFADGRPGAIVVAERYSGAFARQDAGALYPLLSDDARRRVTRERFVQLHREALATATATRVIAGPVTQVDDTHVDIPLTVRTRAFGTVRGTLSLAFTGTGDRPGVDWRRNLVFPGIPEGAELVRTVRLPPRGTLLSRDDQVLAEGDARTPAPDVADVARETVGQLGPIPAERLEELTALGVPPDATVGLSGLERALDERLIGTPGGTLSAGGTVLAQREPRQAKAVRTTIAPPSPRSPGASGAWSR